MTDWYQRRHELEPGQRFRLYDDSIIELDRRVPGDGSKWYVNNVVGGKVFADDDIIEPADLIERLE